MSILNIIRLKPKLEKNSKENFNKDTIKAIKEAEKMEKHPERYKSFDTIEALMKDLNDNRI